MDYKRILRKLKNTIDDYETQEKQEKADRVLIRLKYHLGMSNEWLEYNNIKAHTIISVQEFLNKLYATKKWNTVKILPQAYNLHMLTTKDNKYRLCFNLLKGKIGHMYLEQQYKFINPETQKDDYVYINSFTLFNIIYDEETDKDTGRDITPNRLSYIDNMLFFINKQHINI